MADQQQAVQQPPTETHQPLFEIKYTIGDSNGYKRELIEQLRAKVPHNVIEIKVNETAVDADGNTIEKNNGNHTLRVLAERKSPLQWIHIKLCVEGGEETTTLAVRADNLYVKGFMNKEGKWFELWEEDDTDADGLSILNTDGAQDQVKKLQGWGVMYRKILRLSKQGQVGKILTSTRLGRAFAERAVRRLYRYPDLHKDQGDDMPTRMGLAGLILLVCEAARMEDLSKRIATTSNWDADGTILRADMVARIWEWKNTSASLLQWLAEARLHWDRRCQIEDPAKALEFFYLLLNSKKVEGSGRARVEISKVTADFHVCGITVVDEEEKRITIYTDAPDVNKEHKMRELVLKNALRMGISGCKGFNIIVKSQTSHGAPDHIEMKWDCRKNDRGNIELVTRDIHLENPKRRMNFTYLVMSDAKEVKVEVMVKLCTDKVEQLDNDNQTMECLTDGGSHSDSQGDSGRKYTARGTITARIDGNEHEILLFSHEKDKDVGRGRLGQLRLPIRSDVPVRRGKPLHIDMKDMVVTNVASREQVAAWTESLSIDPQTTEVPCRTIHRVRVKVTWPTPAKEETEVDRSLGL